MSDVLKLLAAPFRPDQVDWRVGATTGEKDGVKTKGMALAYIDARAVMERLDSATGGMWQVDYIPMPNHTCCCRIGIKIGDEWMWRTNGAINYPDSDKGDAKEMAAKGSYSDAFKRAAVLWGIGRYLYDVKSPWVAITPFGKSYVIAESAYAQLNKLLMQGQDAPAQTATPPAAQKMTTAQWAADAIKAIEAFDTKRGLDAWLQRNEPKLTKLAETDKAASADLWGVVDKMADKLNTLVAG